jgi:hypothetical protein
VTERDFLFLVWLATKPAVPKEKWRTQPGLHHNTSRMEDVALMKLLTRGQGKLVFLMLSSIAVVALAACTGDSGSQGIQGPAGPAGFPGNPGAAGVAGAPGNSGNPGESGLSGEPGAPGNPGPVGGQGFAGPAGATGPAGPAGPTGETTGLIIVDAGTNSAGFIELKAVGTTSAEVVGGGFASAEAISLVASSITENKLTNVVFSNEVIANGVGSFTTTLELTDDSFVAGGIYTLDAIGSRGNKGATGFVVVDKVATD